MFKFTKTGINRTILIISIILFCCIQIFIYKITNPITNNTKEVVEEIIKIDEEIVSEQKNIVSEEVEIWQIEIPTISLKAEIAEGTEKETLNKYVGHFEETSTEEGNICLAAHNRGYEVNYFQNIKKLKEGEEIIYKHGKFEKTYEVIKNKIIKDTDWEELENTDKNTITLITCVENEPNYRRCVKAIEKDPNYNY